MESRSNGNYSVVRDDIPENTPAWTTAMTFALRCLIDSKAVNSNRCKHTYMKVRAGSKLNAPGAMDWTELYSKTLSMCG